MIAKTEGLIYNFPKGQSHMPRWKEGGIMERQDKKKKKHPFLVFFGILLLLIIVVVVILAVRIIPVASRLLSALKSQSCAMTIEASLDQQTLTRDQQKFLQNLSMLTGVDQEQWGELTLQGGYDGNALELAVYGGKDTDSPLTQLYLTQDCQAMDIHAIYDRAYTHLTEKVGLLALVLPQWSFGDYVSLQQLEYAFGLQLGELPDIRGKLEQLQTRLSLPLMCGAVLAADQWDRDAQKLIYHITATDRRLALAQQLAKKTGHGNQASFWQLPEGMELDVVIDLAGAQVKTLVTGRGPGVEQLKSWSVELVWGAYTPAEQEISLMDQGILDDLADLLELLKSLQKQ